MNPKGKHIDPSLFIFFSQTMEMVQLLKIKAIWAKTTNGKCCHLVVITWIAFTKGGLKMLQNLPVSLTLNRIQCNSILHRKYNTPQCVISLHSPLSLCAPTITGWQPGSQQPSALLVVILVHTDQQADSFCARCHPQGVCDENSLQGLQQSST